VLTGRCSSGPGSSTEAFSHAIVSIVVASCFGSSFIACDGQILSRIVVKRTLRSNLAIENIIKLQSKMVSLRLKLCRCMLIISCPQSTIQECEMRESSFGHSSPFPYSALARVSHARDLPPFSTSATDHLLRSATWHLNGGRQDVYTARLLSSLVHSAPTA
jgi:hypothetical protein